MAKAYIGIDNGVSGSIGWVGGDIRSGFVPTPTFTCLNYQKTKNQNMQRIDTENLYSLLYQFIDREALVVIERPMVNPKRFQASASALRALEATLITIEELELPYEYCDSKAWQKMLLPNGIKGSANLKRASKEIGWRKWPQLGTVIDQQKDADGLLIAEWAKRSNL